MEQKIEDFKMILDSFLDEDGNQNGEFRSWIKMLSWVDKNIVATILIERLMDENECLLPNFKQDAMSVIRRHQLH